MKKILSLALMSSVFCPIVRLKAQYAEWAVQIGSEWYDGASQLCQDNVGNVYSTGRLGSGNTMLDGHPFSVVGYADVFVMKTSSSGSYQWGVTASGTPSPAQVNEYELGTAIAFDPVTETILVNGVYHGDFIPTTFGPGLSIQGRGVFLAKYDLQGNCLWVRSTLNGLSQGIALDGLGNIVVVLSSGTEYGMNETTFTTIPPTVVPNGLIYAKYSPEGALLWTQWAGDLAGARTTIVQDRAYTTGILFSGGSIFGAPAPDPSPYTGFVAKTDTSLDQLIWMRYFSGPDGERMLDQEVSGDRILTAGTSSDSLFTDWDTLAPPLGGRSFFVYALDTAGNKEWARLMTCTGNSGSPPFISIAPDGSIYCIFYFEGTLTAGSFSVAAESAYDMAVVRLDSNGEVVGLVTGGGFETGGIDVLAAPDNGCYVALTFSNTIDFASGFTAVGIDDAIVAKLGAITGLGELRMPGNSTLHIYANPNNGTCTIDLPDELRLTDDLMLTIVDQTGQVVQRVPLRYSNEGVAIDISAQAKGIYHVELGDGEQRYTGTIVFE